MKTRETTTPVRAFDRAYINGQFVTPHGTQIVDLVNPTDNKVIGKVTMADELDAEKPSVQRKRPSTPFRKVARNTGWSSCGAVARRWQWPSEWINSLKQRSWNTARRKTRAKGSNNLAANIFLHFKKVLEDFDLVKTSSASKIVMEPAGVMGIFTPWNSSAKRLDRDQGGAGNRCRMHGQIIKPSEMSAMQTEVLVDALS